MGTHRSSPPPKALLLLLLPGFLHCIVAAPSQGLNVSPLTCNAHKNQYYDADSQKCCYRCRPGSIAKRECPRNSHTDCRKPCPPDQFLNQKNWIPRCEHCTVCSSARDLVEMSPCTYFSDRVCMCRPGMRCLSWSRNACFLCVPLTHCQVGFGVRTGGNSNGETICEECPPGTFSDQESSTEACKTHTNCSRLNRRTAQKGNSTHDERCGNPVLSLDSQESITTRSTVVSLSVPLEMVPAGALNVTTREPLHEFSITHFAGILPDEKSSKEDGYDFILLGASVLCFVTLFAALLIWWQRKECKKWIIPHRAKLSNQTTFCVKRIRKLSLEDKEEEEGYPERLDSLAGPPDESSLLEPDAAPDLDPERAELSRAGSGALTEPPHLSHTSNCIEKIYIMRADTVIVGSVLEVPAGKICSTRGDGSSGAEDEIEEGELVAHYPEQETDVCPTSNVTTPVEEEWQFSLSSEK